ncbi:MAG: protein meaA [Rhodobacteraceae bacterium]|nr:protein meaA [Paracoccaceae bacterium]
MVLSQPDSPWIFRTYAGHSTAIESNSLFRRNLAKGQTGLSVAFDLPTQTGYDSDHELARGEVGKVGVPICHLGDMRRLFDQIPLDHMNTSMTINATAAWILALYIALAEEQDIDPSQLRGTVQNDIIKEYLSRGTYIFPPEPSLQLAADIAVFCRAKLPKWNPTNVCSYHLQEAGATAEQELAYALSTAIALLDRLRMQVTKDDFPQIVGQVSFFVNAGIRFIREMCKMRAFSELWDEICRTRYGIEDSQLRRFRYGVQVNSLGLTERQPENNVFRILIEMLAVTLSRNARARAIQLPAWNEAIGLPRPWDQQWSLRMQQILALETDLLEFSDIFDGSAAIEKEVDRLKVRSRNEMAVVESMGGAVAAIEHMKSRLVESNCERVRQIESGNTIVVGINQFTESETSPLSTGDSISLKIDSDAEAKQISDLREWRSSRNETRVCRSLDALRQAAETGDNIVPPSIDAAKAGATTGEWGQVLRQVFGQYRAPTGVSPRPSNQTADLASIRAEVDLASQKLGRRLRILIAKPGLDGHSNGAEQIACRARDCGMDVIYPGIRFTAASIVKTAITEQAHVIGLSILSGSHMSLVAKIISDLEQEGAAKLPLVVGGIIPPDDVGQLQALGVAAIYTSKDYELNQIMRDIVRLVAPAQRAA